MADPTGNVMSVVIHVDDIEREKDFWTAFLGVGVAREIPGAFAWLEPQREGAPLLALQKVEELTEGPNRLHIDTAVTELDAGQKKVEELGGSFLAERSMGDFTWRVMADPEGNEFCIAKPPDDWEG